jgi:predicted phosphodiesterase
MPAERRALISDIHANLEALEAVLAHIERQGIREIVCLGDIIGYGPDPVACLDLVMEKCDLTILGNHDQATIFDPEGFNPVALKAIFWTRDQLDKGFGGSDKIDNRWDFIGELPRRHDEGEFLFVHGSPRDPTNEYVFPEHVYERSRMDTLMRRFDKYCFQGHTHIPGVFTESGHFFSPDSIEYTMRLGDEKLMFNVGSVGQPRDEDPRACYVELNAAERSVRYHRVEYDFGITRNKIYSIPELDNMLGDRLSRGA